MTKSQPIFGRLNPQWEKEQFGRRHQPAALACSRDFIGARMLGTAGHDR